MRKKENIALCIICKKFTDIRVKISCSDLINVVGSVVHHNFHKSEFINFEVLCKR